MTTILFRFGKRFFFVCFLTFFSLFTTVLPTSAQTNEAPETTSYVTRENRAYAVTTREVNIRFKGDRKITLLLKLDKPLYNHSGKEIIPSGTDIEAVIELVDGGAKITAKNLIIHGIAIPIEAFSHDMSLHEQVIKTGSQKTAELLVYTRLGGRSLGSLAFDEPELGEIMGILVPMVVGPIFLKNDVEKAIYIPEGQSIPLQIETPIALSTEVAQILHGDNSPQFARNLPLNSHQVESYNPVDSELFPVIAQSTGCSKIAANQRIVNYPLGLGVHQQPDFKSPKLEALPMASVVELDDVQGEDELITDDNNIVWQKIKAPVSGFVAVGRDGTVKNLKSCNLYIESATTKPILSLSH